MKKIITVKIERAKKTGYNYQYVFCGRRVYTEYETKRYIRLLGTIRNLNLKEEV